jgi:outer membrane protein OmpA-like peptidoglycan-associated protein
MRTILLLIPIMIASCSNVIGQSSDTINSAPIQVLVTDFENNPQKGEQIIFEGLKSKSVYKGVSNSEGKFEILLKGGETYLIKIKSVGDADDYNKFEIPALGENETYAPSTLTIQIELPKTFTLDNVEFEFGKSTLTKGSYSELKELLEYLKLKDGIIIEIAGHTDVVGDEESNLKLSEARAETVRNYLISKGISSERVVAKGYGESQPIAPNSTPEGRQKNRRTEVRIIND